MNAWQLLGRRQEDLVDILEIVGKEGANETHDDIRPGVWADTYLQGIYNDLKLVLFVPKIIPIHYVGLFDVTVTHGGR